MFLPKMHELNLFMRKQENSNWEIYYTMTVLCTSKISRSKKEKELRQCSRLKETKCSLKFGSILWTIEIGGLCGWLRIYLSICLFIYLSTHPSIHLHIGIFFYWDNLHTIEYIILSAQLDNFFTCLYLCTENSY